MGSIRVAWWNLQNLFDTDDDPISADLEFTVAKGWTPEVYAAKKANLAAAINEFHGGQGPELLGVAEVEGDDVFGELLAAMGAGHMKVVEDPGGTSDLRGIDVSLAYDDRKLRVLEQRSHMVNLRYPTRDIFEVVFELVETNARLVVIAQPLAVAAPGAVALGARADRRGREHRLPGPRSRALRRPDLSRPARRERPRGRPAALGDPGAGHGRLQRRAARPQRRRAPAGVQRARPRRRGDQRHHGVRGRGVDVPQRRHVPVQPVLALPRGRRTPAPSSSAEPPRRRSPTATRCSTS